MKTLITLSTLAFALVTGSALAADENAGEKKPGAQQTKMKTCNKEATEKGLKKAERKAFMSDCLKSHKQ